MIDLTVKQPSKVLMLQSTHFNLGVVFLQIPVGDIRLPKRGRLLAEGEKLMERQ